MSEFSLSTRAPLRQRLCKSTWEAPRFLRSYEETLDGGLILPRGLIDRVALPVEQAGSRLELAKERACGQPQEFTFTATLSRPQQTQIPGEQAWAG